MRVIEIEKIPDDYQYHEIVNIDFNIKVLVVTVEFDGYMLDISFDAPKGFRVLDEGDLNEFWPLCSTDNGWLYQIVTGGWLDQESKRKGFISSYYSELKEYFITGEDFCINIIAYEPPIVENSIGAA